MAKKKSNQKITPTSILMGIIGAIVVAVASYFGIDITAPATDTDTSSPAAVPTQPLTLPENVEAPDVSFTEVAAASGSVQVVDVNEGFGATKDFWQVYFTAPRLSDAEAEETCMGGIDEVVVNQINNVQATLDIAAFEWKNACITRAVLAAAGRGVQVRMVVDDEHVLDENEEYVLLSEVSPFQWIIDASLPFKPDDSRSRLMHNKFMIFDGQIVLTGSMNFTPRGTYTNNNNLVVLRSRRAAQAYQVEFNEMYEQEVFGPRNDTPNNERFNQDGVPIRILFSPDDNVVGALIDAIESADSHVRFMTFSFTRDDVGAALLERAGDGIDISGIFEVRGSETEFSEMPALFCAGLNVRQDGNGQTFHHKVFIIDDHTVLTGSFNISDNATESNDENLLVIEDRDFAAQYLAEFERVMAESRAVDPADIECP